MRTYIVIPKGCGERVIKLEAACWADLVLDKLPPALSKVGLALPAEVPCVFVELPEGNTFEARPHVKAPAATDPKLRTKAQVWVGALVNAFPKSKEVEPLVSLEGRRDVPIENPVYKAIARSLSLDFALQPAPNGVTIDGVLYRWPPKVAEYVAEWRASL